MAAEEHLGDQFITVFRGIRSHPDHVNTERLGNHWTQDPYVAREFATYNDHDEFDEPAERHGTVVVGKVHKSAVVTPHTSEWYGMGGISMEDAKNLDMMGEHEELDHAILPPEHSEKETTIRSGSEVHINRMEHFLNGVRQTDNYQPKED